MSRVLNFVARQNARAVPTTINVCRSDDPLAQAEIPPPVSAAPTTVREDLAIDLPAERDQLGTRSLRRFAELRAHVYSQIERGKQRHG